MTLAQSHFNSTPISALTRRQKLALTCRAKTPADWLTRRVALPLILTESYDDLVLYHIYESPTMSSTTKPSSGSPSSYIPPPKSDPFTKWATRALVLLVTLASFSWLDTIKVRPLASAFLRTAPTDIYDRTDGMSSTRSTCMNSNSPPSPPRPTTRQA